MDKSNITAWSQVSQPIVQDERTGQPEQIASFEQVVRPFLSDDLRAEYRHLSDEDRRLIESAIRAAFVRGEVDLASGGRYANNLASFANSLGSKGLSMVGLNTNELEAERKAGHNRGAYLPKALDHLRKFRDPDASAEAGSSRKPRGRSKIKNFPNEQLMGGPPPKRRRLLDDEPPHLTVLVDPGELRRPEERLHGELQPQRHAEPGLLALVSPDHFIFDPVQFPPAELRQVLDEEPAGAPFFNVDPEHFTLDPVQLSPGQLQRLQDDEPTPFEQQVRSSSRQPQSQPNTIDIRNEQFIDSPAARIWRLLDDEPAQLAVSIDPGELRELEERLREELHPQRGAEPGPLALIDPEHLTFDAVQFPPAEFRQLLDDEPAGTPFFNVDPEHFTFDPVQLPPSEHRRLLNDEPVPNEAGPLPPLSFYAPPGWQHGNQWAPEDLKEGMLLHNVLPSVFEPEKTLTLRGVNYTATIGPPGLEHEIFLRRTI
ncbi:hypothetical protein [Bradyrhizobium glycinis]|uniref:hypothetical protein n=1 Tax=Bradyrhizobium glycinis TaxID=2751812 RepID=UPI0018D8FFFB|nr:hypothetical protein [Bradyrhizobium glycinis]MBH5371110.1 hypothetical protein [Bradyrhizobium glycinis]